MAVPKTSAKVVVQHCRPKSCRGLMWHVYRILISVVEFAAHLLKHLPIPIVHDIAHIVHMLMEHVMHHVEHILRPMMSCGGHQHWYLVTATDDQGVERKYVGRRRMGESESTVDCIDVCFHCAMMCTSAMSLYEVNPSSPMPKPTPALTVQYAGCACSECCKAVKVFDGVGESSSPLSAVSPGNLCKESAPGCCTGKVLGTSGLDIITYHFLCPFKCGTSHGLQRSGKLWYMSRPLAFNRAIGAAAFSCGDPILAAALPGAKHIVKNVVQELVPKSAMPAPDGMERAGIPKDDLNLSKDNHLSEPNPVSPAPSSESATPTAITASATAPKEPGMADSLSEAKAVQESEATTVKKAFVGSSIDPEHIAHLVSLNDVEVSASKGSVNTAEAVAMGLFLLDRIPH